MMWKLTAVYKENCGPEYGLAGVCFKGVRLNRLLDLLQHLAKGYLTKNPVKQHPAFQVPEWVAYDELVDETYYIRARYHGGDILLVSLHPLKGEPSPEVQVLKKVQPEVPKYKRIDPRSEGLNTQPADYTIENFQDWLSGWIKVR